jgi:ABC-2 type transport system permease protein
VTRWSKIRAVATFEFLGTVKRKGYLIGTFGMPMFVLLYGLVVSGVGLVIDKAENEVRIVGIVDNPSVLGMSGDEETAVLDLPEHIQQTLDTLAKRHPAAGALTQRGKFVFRPFEDLRGAAKALTAGQIRGYFLLPPDYMETGRVEEFFTDAIDLGGSDARGALRRLLQDRLIENRLPDEIAERVRTPVVESDQWTVSGEGKVEERSDLKLAARLIVPLAFAVLLFVSLMMTAGYLVQATAVEKENKVVEVLLSSANPEEVLTGKLLGLGAAGLLQIVIWFGMVIVAALISASALTSFGVEVPWAAIGIGLLFFLAGYLFLGSLMLGFGSLGNSMRESQQYTIVVTLLAASPMMLLPVMTADAHSMPALVMTWIPFSAPLTVILRMTLGPAGIGWWEIVGSWLVLAGSTWFALRLGARLFRVGLLLTGTRPKLRESIRQARLSL